MVGRLFHLWVAPLLIVVAGLLFKELFGFSSEGTFVGMGIALLANVVLAILDRLDDIERKIDQEWGRK